MDTDTKIHERLDDFNDIIRTSACDILTPKQPQACPMPDCMCVKFGHVSCKETGVIIQKGKVMRDI